MCNVGLTHQAWTYSQVSVFRRTLHIKLLKPPPPLSFLSMSGKALSDKYLYVKIIPARVFLLRNVFHQLLKCSLNVILQNRNVLTSVTGFCLQQYCTCSRYTNSLIAAGVRWRYVGGCFLLLPKSANHGYLTDKWFSLTCTQEVCWPLHSCKLEK